MVLFAERRRRKLYDDRAIYFDRLMWRYELVSLFLKFFAFLKFLKFSVILDLYFMQVYGIFGWRKRLMPRAEGHVLEIGAGMDHLCMITAKQIYEAPTP